MSTVQIREDLCMFQGLCATAAPQVFEFSDDEGPRVVAAHPSGALLDEARMAASMCPARAIEVTND